VAVREGEQLSVMSFTFSGAGAGAGAGGGERIVALDVVTDRAHLREPDLTLLSD
jgi:hypothetical protein